MAPVIEHLNIVVIAGGSGTRFWPLSRQRRPKQLLNLTQDRSLLAATFDRVMELTPPEGRWMVVGKLHAGACRDAVGHLVADHCIVEPKSRNTAPAIAIAAVRIRKRDPNALMVVLPADHDVQNRAAFVEAIRCAARVAADGTIVTLGIEPARPETGYGYIEQGAPHPAGHGALIANRFCEKPDRKKAESLLAAGNYSWNAGIFVMRVDRFLAELERQLPEHHRAFAQLGDVLDTPRFEATLRAVYDSIEGISVDYGIMENADNIAVIPTRCGWSDVGGYRAAHEIAAGRKDTDDDGNLARGDNVLVDADNCYVLNESESDHVVAVVGLKDIAVVHTEDATLVVPLDRAQDVRQVVARLRDAKRQEYL